MRIPVIITHIATVQTQKFNQELRFEIFMTRIVYIDHKKSIIGIENKFHHANIIAKILKTFFFAIKPIPIAIVVKPNNVRYCLRTAKAGKVLDSYSIINRHSHNPEIK